MSNIEPDDLVLSEEEKALLERWRAPEPSEALDKRVTGSFLREFGQADVISESTPFRQNEVVTMKFCSTCQEEYADKFSFCPVDGTPLNGFVPNREETFTAPARLESTESVESEPPVTESFPAAPIGSVTETYTASSAPERAEYHLTIMDDAGLASRLATELRDVAHQYELTWPEFKRDPIGFMKRSAQGYGEMASRFFGNRYAVIALGSAFLAMVVLVAGIALMDRSGSQQSSRAGLIIFTLIAFGSLVGIFATRLGRDRGAAVMGGEGSDSQNVVLGVVASFVVIFAVVGGFVLFDSYKQQQAQEEAVLDELVVQQLIDIPSEQPTPDPGTAGLNKGDGGGSKPKPEKAAGGGGGGREQQRPASFGKTPQASLTVPQVVAPDPNPPPIRNPSLPVAATVVADPLLVPPDVRVLPYGDPKSRSTDLSSGPGTGGGIGSGTGGGIGPGEGGGIGPGRGGNIGGGDRNDGGGGPGGGGGGKDVYSGREVTQKARVLSKPEPQYTEDARKNQITGTVVLRAVFTSGGQVSNIRAVKGLPFGLTERAIAAARRIRFQPAMKDGRPVSMHIQLEYNFNLY